MLIRFRRLWTAHLKKWANRIAFLVGAVLLSLSTIMLVLGLYRANTGIATYGLSYNRTLDIAFTCGTQAPGVSLSGPGAVIFHGERQPIRAIHVFGPVQPQLSTNVANSDLEDAATAAADAASITRHAFLWTCIDYTVGASIRIYFAALALLAVALAVVYGFRRRDLVRPLFKLGGFFGAVLTITWVVSLLLAVLGSLALGKVNSPTDVFKYAVTRTLPPPRGPENPDPIIAVDGDSRLSGFNGDKLVLHPTANDITCERTRSNVAAQLAQRFQVPVLDNSCPGADIDLGILTKEMRHGRTLPEQFSVDESAHNLQYIIVDPGMNGVGWGLLAGGAQYTDANIAPVRVAVKAAIDHMRPALEDLLAGYRSLRGPPHVIIVGSYTVFADGASCSATKKYSPDEIVLMNQENALINAFLATEARDHSADFVLPHLTPLCTPLSTGLGADIVSVGSKYQFHPTPLGETKITDQVAPYIHLKVPPITQPPATGPPVFPAWPTLFPATIWLGHKAKP